MSRFLTRLFIVAALLCGYLGSNVGAKARYLSANGTHKSEAQIRQSDGWLRQVAEVTGYAASLVEEPQAIPVAARLSAPSSNRVASSRPTRLLPTHGGKPTNSAGRWAKGKSFNPQLFPLLRPCRRHCRQRMAATPPRLRYVIALRRLLC
ncbi:MAG: hypothetical protein IJ064_02085 [Bacteroidaceae bacterium]|nr:hypothetical protein [Bacteroidaceae bacterium]